MAYVDFEIPQNLKDLLTDTDEHYYVRCVIGEKEMPSALKTAKQCYKDQGPEYILENFDVYYSIIHHSDKLQMHEIFVGFDQLHKAAQDLHKSVSFLVEDQDNLTEEVKAKFLNVLKMLVYIYSNMICTIEQKNENKRMQTLNIKKSRKKSDDNENFNIQRKSVLLAITYLLEQDINIFWDPPVVEEAFVKVASEVCYKFLEIPSIKEEKDVLLGVWRMLGLLITKMNHGMTFIVRMVQLIKTHEHLTHFVAEGIRNIVETYKCKGLVRDLIREITEWQCDETFTDSEGTRNCSKVLSDMAAAMPKLMMDEVVYLNQYLAHESYALRNCALNVMVEVIIINLTRKDLSEDEKETRDELLGFLEEHTADISPHVRAKVFQHWKTLQQENAIPIFIQSRILERVVDHLRDKGAIARRAASNCVTTFLEHNTFSSELSLKSFKAELDKTTKALHELTVEMEGFEVTELKKLDEEWCKHETPILETLKDNLSKPTQEDPVEEIDTASLIQNIRDNIIECDYESAINLARIASKTSEVFKKVRNEIESEEEINLFILLIKMIFFNIQEQFVSAGNGKRDTITREKLDEITRLRKIEEYLAEVVKFCEQIDRARGLMKDLLESVNIGDMQEAVKFFVAAYKFKVDDAHLDVLDMLRIMQCSEIDRRKIVLEALKLIYLTTDSKSLNEHTRSIIDGLITLLKVVPYNKEIDLTLMISEWCLQGILDNSIIDMLWQYVTQKVDVSDESSRAALHLLTMAAQGRRTIISRNIKLVSAIAFGKRGQSDILLATQGCKILSIVGMEKQDVTDANPPFRVKFNDEMWQQLGDILVAVFTKKVKFVNNFIFAAIDLIYRLCSMPIKLLQTLVKSLFTKVTELEGETLPMFIIIRCNILLGQIALKHLNFLDETIYKELKRRQHIKNEKANQKNDTTIKKRDRKKAQTSALNASQISITDENVVLEGAEAEDQDAEFISHMLNNNTVSTNSTLGNFANLVISVCEQPNIYDDPYLQCSSITALLRLMLVSDVFCKKNMPLVFTILEKTTFDDVKIAILVHCSDLLERFPNIVEPYTPKIFERLEDKSLSVRMSTFYMLSNLILRDMIRAQGYISQMAKGVIDEENEMIQMAKDFFLQLSHKGNNLYNVLPDIFTHLMETISEEKLRKVMSFLFTLIDKNKLMENLVDRFCVKFKFTENEVHLINIAFCLTLINYNEKGLKKLIENFIHYRHLILVDDIYLLFKKIINNCSKGLVKPEMKALVVELEEKIKEMFELTENAKIPEAPKSVKKRKPQRKRNNKKSTAWSGDSESDIENQPSQVKNRSRMKKKKRYENSDSDS